MAQQPPTIAFEDAPPDQARRMSRGTRMDPELYHALTQNIQSLGTTAIHMPLPEGINPNTMKNRILRVAAELGMPVTIRKIPGGLLPQLPILATQVISPTSALFQAGIPPSLALAAPHLCLAVQGEVSAHLLYGFVSGE